MNFTKDRSLYVKQLRMPNLDKPRRVGMCHKNQKGLEIKLKPPKESFSSRKVGIIENLNFIAFRFPDKSGNDKV